MNQSSRPVKGWATVLATGGLVVALVVAGVGRPALAAPSRIVAPAFSDVAGHDAEFELSALAALGVFSGDSGLGGKVRPDDPITRAEFCKVVVTGMGKAGIAASLSSLPPAYADGASVSSWAWGYVNTALMMGVVLADPYGDGTFRPSKSISRAEAVTMLVRAVPGHKDRVSPSPWPANYVEYARAHGFLGEVELVPSSAPCSRGEMAILLFAAIQVEALDPFASPVPRSAILTDRIASGVLVDYGVGESVNVVEIDRDGNGAIEPDEIMLLAPTVCLARAAGLLGLKSKAVTVLLGSGENAGKVVFLGGL